MLLKLTRPQTADQSYHCEEGTQNTDSHNTTNTLYSNNIVAKLAWTPSTTPRPQTLGEHNK